MQNYQLPQKIEIEIQHEITADLLFVNSDDVFLFSVVSAMDQSICLSKKFIGVDTGTRGALSEWVSVPEENLFLMPEDMPFESGALAEPFAVGAGAVRNAYVQEGDRVAIIGAGVIGLAVLHMLRGHNLGKVFIVDNNAERLALAESFSAIPIDFTKTDPVIVAGNSDVSIEAVGMTAAVSTALNVLKPGGLCVWIGNSQKIIEVNMQDVVVRAKRITGTYCYNDDFSIIPYLKLSLWNKHLSDHFTFS